MNGYWKMFNDEVDYFFDVRVWKDEIQSSLGTEISDKEFDMIMESFDVFHLNDLIHGYIKKNKEIIIELIKEERKSK